MSLAIRRARRNNAKSPGLRATNARAWPRDLGAGAGTVAVLSLWTLALLGLDHGGKQQKNKSKVQTFFFLFFFFRPTFVGVVGLLYTTINKWRSLNMWDRFSC